MQPALEIDEQALESQLADVDQRLGGVYFTPAELVRLTLDAVAPLVPAGPLAIVDPACGAGAFLAHCADRFPEASLHGLELSSDGVGLCQQRVPGATILRGDALRGGLTPLLADIPENAFELWVGNPPYNGTSSLLQDAAAYGELRRLLPADFALPPGTSLRDDYAFFLLLAARRLSTRFGALAFVTSATLIDAFLYAPFRHALLKGLRLHEVIELGAGLFEGTRVRTCVTVWSSAGARSQIARYRTRADPAAPFQLTAAVPLRPAAPHFQLRPTPPGAEALNQAFRASGEPLSRLVPISFPGLKTRFDELLTDDDPDRLFARVEELLATPGDGLGGFAERHGLPARHHAKLEALHRAAAEHGVRADRASLRPFLRYAGSRHREGIPADARSFCYLDRRLIPRGDHRLQGDYDPHRGEVKLAFNTRELPLAATVVRTEGCVHAHRHSRFAPLMVPERIREEGPAAARAHGELGPLVPNLSPRGRRWAARLGGPLHVFEALATFINSPQVQDVWAPAYGTSAELWVPIPPTRRGRTGEAGAQLELPLQT